MLELTSLDEIRGNNVVVYTLKTLLAKKTFPHFMIFTGHKGVGKTSAAMLVAKAINGDTHTTVKINFGLSIDMKTLEEDVFKLNPVTPRAFVFEELHGLDKAGQTALLSMLDGIPSNVCIIATTTEAYKILGTIKSRATVLDFKLLGDRQLAQLLDDYLESKHFEMSQASKNILIRASRGVPRDLLKSVDLAIAGNFTQEQLEELLGQVSEDFMYTMLCTLKSPSVDFAGTIIPLLSGEEREKLYQLRDFYTRFLLERKGSDVHTINKQKVDALSAIFTDAELTTIGRTLVKATPDTLMLELTLLNMELTGATRASQVGQQLDKMARQTGGYVPSSKPIKEVTSGYKVSADSLRTLHLGDVNKPN